MDEVGTQFVRGWATDGSGGPDLVLRVNGTVVQSFRPSLRRADLVAIGMGNAAFHIVLDHQLASEDLVEVTTVGGQHLEGSPHRVVGIASAEVEPEMSRMDKVMALIDRSSMILEIGPSFNPVAPKRDGWNCYTLDHASREQLRAKYHDSQDVDRIEEVDFIWTDGPIASAVPEALHGQFDAIIASHVIEHFPDPIGFYKSASTLLKDGGVITLVVPDKRMMFDFFKPVTLTSDLLQQHHRAMVRHSRKTAFDNLAYNVFNNGASNWSAQVTPGFAFFDGTGALARAYHTFESMSEDGSAPYLDFHHTIQTPASFALVLLELSELGVIPLAVARRYPTASGEFFVTLRKQPLVPMPPEALSEARLGLLRDMIVEQAEQADWLLQRLAGETTASPAAAASD